MNVLWLKKRMRTFRFPVRRRLQILQQVKNSPTRVVSPPDTSTVGWILQRNKLTGTSVKVTRGKGCIGYPRTYKWGLSLSPTGIATVASEWCHTLIWSKDRWIFFRNDRSDHMKTSLNIQMLKWDLYAAIHKNKVLLVYFKFFCVLMRYLDYFPQCRDNYNLRLV